MSTTQVIYGGTTDQLGTSSAVGTHDGSTEYASAFGNHIIGGSYTGIPWPAAGDVRHLIAWLSAAPGAGATRDIEITEGNVTQLTASFGAADTTAEDTGTAAIAAGSNVRIHCHTTGTPAAAYLRYAYLWEPTTAGQTVVACCLYSTQLSAAAAQFLPLTGCLPTPLSTEPPAEWYQCTPGTYSNMYVQLSAAPGVGKKNRIIQFRKNGATDALFKVSIAEANTAGNDTSDTVSVADGDYVNLRSAIFGAPEEQAPAQAYVAVSCVFTPDDPDLFLMGGTSSDNLPTGTVTRYRQLQTGGDSFNAARTGRDYMAHKMQIKRARLHSTVAPTSPAYWRILVYNVSNEPWADLYSGTSNNEVSEAPVNVADWRAFSQQVYASVVPNSAPTNVANLSTCYACRMVPVRSAPWLF